MTAVRSIRTWVLPAACALAWAPTARAQAPDVPEDLVRTSPSGLRSEDAAERAAATSYTAAAAEASVRAAAARVDAAWVAFLPRLSGTARYTRMSDFTPLPIGASQGYLVGTKEPPSTNPATGQPSFINPDTLASVPPIAFPPVLDNYLLQATITVPVSDWFLRTNNTYGAAKEGERAARFDAQAARARSGLDGRVTYYAWLRARGAVIVAAEAVRDQKAHLTDANNQFTQGNASRADVLRAETAVSAADLALVRAKDLAEVTEEQVRVAIHAPEGTRLVPAESLDAPLAPVQGELGALRAEALSARPEVRSLEAASRSAHRTATERRNTRLPSLSAFADAVEANPNPRRIPLSNEWFPTWDVGAQLTWSPNDVLLGTHTGNEAEARAVALEAQREAMRDGVRLEVMQALRAAQEADVAVESTQHEMTSAEEAYRVVRGLFANGRATSALVTDAETDLQRARLGRLNARADARVARARLDHALGRDVRVASLSSKEVASP